MAVKPSIKCNCGQRIVEKDVMQTGYYLRLLGPSFVYVKFRCSRCKKLGEQFVKQDQWEDGMLRDTHAEIEQNEKEGFKMMGPISVNEQIDFHFNLETTEALSSLKNMMAVEKEMTEPAEVETRE